MIPWLPSRVMVCPFLKSVVAFLTAVTAGMPYSRETTAPWLRIPPVSVMSPESFLKIGVQAGSVFRVMRMSLFLIFPSSVTS